MARNLHGTSRRLVQCLLRHHLQQNTLNRRGIKTRELRSSQLNPPALLPDLKYNDDLFNYTRGRFLHNEAYELSQRRVCFDINELARCAAKAVGARVCVHLEKYPDGMYNKSMLLTMDNGAQVVAKVPNPNAGVAHFTTASEVATMDFMRNVLATPVPRVLARHSRAEDNPVGAEYIIMEKAPGVELERLWPSMNIKDRLALVRSLAGYQKAWTSIPFTKFGSLYYRKDPNEIGGDGLSYIDVNGNHTVDRRFAVGPSVGRELYDNGRASVFFNRGPWSSLEEYHAAIGHRETACVTQIATLPKSPVTLCGPGTYQPTREKKLKALECYLKLIGSLLPTDRALSTAHLWHDDLHVANILVNASRPTEITGIIDWQSTEIAPLYFHARQPQLIDYDGPPICGLERPQPPRDVEKLEPSARIHAETLYLQQSLCSLYNTLVHRQNLKLYAALEFQQTLTYVLLLLPRNLLVDGEATYLAQVAELESAWDTLPGSRGSAYPFSFSHEDRKQIDADAEGAFRGIEAMRAIKESIGDLFPEQGIVGPEDYDEAVDALAQMKQQVIEKYASTKREAEIWEEVWPFTT